ncbi:hypothetical protein ACPOL_4685 [Acidisarcina polymorpha]|uniref:Uncharacterized protein n=1 Tax=Acidisarcina polymorpha TaxID=2211140 RepID=A0A2Z5G5P8_9BACT|nr:hypothetical protein ACPOL_4685 [Acidisarcina polymorpha]
MLYRRANQSKASDAELQTSSVGISVFGRRPLSYAFSI